MGFSPEVAEEVLLQENNFEVALNYLLNNRAKGTSKPLMAGLEAEESESSHRQDRIPPFNTFSCLVDINLPTIYFYPRNFYKFPLLYLQLPKLLAMATHEMNMPFIEKGVPLCPSADRVLSFPHASTDYVCKKFDPGFERAVTKMQVEMFPWGIFDTTRGKDQSQALVEFGEANFGIRWDYSSTPQFIFSFDVSSLTVRMTQEQLNFGYLLHDEYSRNGPPAFWLSNQKMESDFELVDLLDYLPNPSNLKISKSAVGLYDIWALLPTYLISYNLRKFSAIFEDNHKGEEVVRKETSLNLLATTVPKPLTSSLLHFDIYGISVDFEHHSASNREEHAQTTKRGVAIKSAIQNAFVRNIHPQP